MLVSRLVGYVRKTTIVHLCCIFLSKFINVIICSIVVYFVLVLNNVDNNDAMQGPFDTKFDTVQNPVKIDWHHYGN